SFCFYDDGAEGAVTLHELSKLDEVNLANTIKEHNEILNNLVKGQNVRVYNQLLFRYLWNNVIKTSYCLCNTSLLDKGFLPILKKQMGNIELMNFNKFHNFSDYQKDMMASLLNIKTNDIHNIINLSKMYKSTVLLGTTVFNISEDSIPVLESIHFNAIKEMTLPKGRFFNNKNDHLFFYKGHPHAKELNNRIKENFEHLIIIPDHIAFETLLLLGFKLDSLVGFAGTALFGVSKDIISDQIFLTKGEEKYRGSYLFNQQYELSQSLLSLGYIREENVHFFDDFL
ncbi:hypothetical protein ACWIVY_11175, partial [Ursidibacter sp. B-7004-1]